MKVLLDTHAFFWWLSAPQTLTPAAAGAIADPANEVLVSIISLREIAIKRVIGKLQAPVNLQTDVTQSGFQLLPLAIAHLVATEQLPLHHRDPFDRLLIAQARIESAILITRDSNFLSYGVPLIVA